MADPSWLLGVVVVVSVAVGIFFIILTTLLMYYCWWKRRTPRDARYDDSSSMTSSTDSGGKLSSRHGSSRAFRQERLGNGFFTVPAPRMHHDQRWSLQHKRNTPVGRRYKKRIQGAGQRNIHNYRTTQSDIGVGQHRQHAKSLDSKSIKLFLTEHGHDIHTRKHMRAQGIQSQTFIAGNNNQAYRDDMYSTGGATIGGLSNMTTVINGQPHRYHSGTSQTTGNFYVASVETASDAITSTPRDDGISISGPVLTSDREIISSGSRYSPRGYHTLPSGPTARDNGISVSGPVLTSDREIISSGSRYSPRVYNTLPSGPTWVVNSSNSGEHSFDHSDMSHNSRISGPLIVSDTVGVRSHDTNILW